MTYLATELMGLGVESFLATYLANNQGGGSASIEFVATFADLPASADDGTLGFTNDTKVLYIWDGTQWYQITKWKLTANTSFFVNGSTGSDSNDGLTSGTAWATLQHAWNYLSTAVDYNGFQVTVSIADGTYVGPNSNDSGGAIAPQGRTTWRGNTSTPANVVFGENGFGYSVNNFAACPHIHLFDGVTFEGYYGVDWEANSNIPVRFQRCRWGTSIQYVGVFTFAANAQFFGSNVVTAATGMNYFALGIVNSICQVSATIDMTANPAFSGAIFGASQGSQIILNAGISGSPTGNRFELNTGSQLVVSNGGNPDSLVNTSGAMLLASGCRVSGPNRIQVKTSAYTVTNTFIDYSFSNRGATARVDFTLPAVNATSGYGFQRFTFICEDTDGLRIIAPGTETINLAGTVSAAGGRLDSTQIGSSVTLRATNTGTWVAESATGTWTVT